MVTPTYPRGPLDIIERAMAIVDARTGRNDKHGVPVDYKAANALVLRASESRRKLYGVDAPAKMTTTFEPLMTDEEAKRILAELDELDGCTCGARRRAEPV